MATSLKTLLKKGKLTGDEVGRLMIKDLAATYNNVLKNRNIDGLLSDLDKQSLVSGLEKRDDIRRYNEYKYIHEFLTNAPVLFCLYQQTASLNFWKLYGLMEKTIIEETESNFSKLNNPKIVTQKQYDDMKKAQLESALNGSWSPEILLMHTVEHYLYKYRAGKRTAFNKYFTASKKKKLTSDRLKAVISENWEPGDYSSMFDVLESVEAFYSSEETGDSKAVFEFMNDFPDLYKALWEHITQMKGLSFLKDLQDDDYTNWDLISCRLLYDNDILDFKEYFEDFKLDECLAGVAVLQEEQSLISNVDENGYYMEPTSPWGKRNTAEYFIETFGETVKDLLKEYKYNFKYTYVMKEALNIIGDFINVKEIDILIGDINEGEITHLNFLSDSLIDSIDRFDIDENERLQTQLRELLPPVNIDDLRPLPEDIKKAREIFNFTTLQDGSNKFLSLIAGEGGEQWE